VHLEGAVDDRFETRILLTGWIFVTYVVVAILSEPGI
jgi:hypothetical protein